MTEYEKHSLNLLMLIASGVQSLHVHLASCNPPPPALAEMVEQWQLRLSVAFADAEHFAATATDKD